MGEVWHGEVLMGMCEQYRGGGGYVAMMVLGCFI